jgi:hypothetical protein
MAKQTQESKIAKTVLWVNTIFKGKVTFCGSFGLKINGKIDREVHDIDCITDKDWYAIPPHKYIPKKFSSKDDFYQVMAIGNSAKFYVHGVLIKCFKLVSPQGITIDVMYRPDGVHSSEHEFEGVKIKVERPESAIEVKHFYLENFQNMQGCTGQSYEKHKQDLIHMKAF